MEWYEPLYVGLSVGETRRQLVQKIKKRSPWVRAYLVCLPSNSQNLFDIIAARELSQKGYPVNNLYVIGLCGTHEEAVELVSALVQESVRCGYQTDVQAFLGVREKKREENS